MASLVLDTNTLANSKLLLWLKNSDEESWLPAVAFMEASYHTLKRNRSVEDFLQALDAAGIRVLPFDRDQATEAARAAIGRWDFSTKARDYAIGSAAKARNATLVTENKRDFSWLPLVKSPREVMTAR
ncbi:MAG: type II toxin-antitoxin system VapC family toxin [Methanobacteriota archaeon]